MPLSKPLPVCKRFPVDIDVGDYVQTAPLPTKIRCKAYTDPPSRVNNRIVFEGGYICTLDPGTYIGPVEKSFTANRIGRSAFVIIGSM